MKNCIRRSSALSRQLCSKGLWNNWLSEYKIVAAAAM